MPDTITCPSCHAEIPLSDAVTHSLREEFNKDFAERQRKMELEAAARQKQFDAQRQQWEQEAVTRQKNLETQLRQLDQAKLDLEGQVAQRLVVERKKLAEQALKEAREGVALELQDAKSQLAERNQKLEEAQRNELALRQQQREVEERAKNLELEVTRKVNAERARVQEEAREGYAIELQDTKTQLAERSQKLEEAQRNELALRQQQREVEERAKNLELEVTRKVDSERARVQEEARRAATEEQLMRLADKEKLINDLKTQIETLKQKAEQGSQQSQGEVMEMQLEDLLKQAFVLDEFLPVPQGTRGADLLQKVHNTLGQSCGTIIWESKRTKNWSPAWLGKLKDDQRAQGAELAILVSQVLPDGVSHGGHVDGVWICNFPFALALAAALRNGLLQVAAARRAESGREEKMEVLYKFLSSSQFKHQVEGVVEAFVEMRRDLDSERRAMERLWKKREMQLTRVLNGTSGLYGSLQGIMGSAALPEIRALELGGEDEEKAGSPAP